MDIQRAAILFLDFATVTALVAVTLAGCALLLVPVWPTVFNLSALPEGAVFARRMQRQPCATAFTTAKMLLITSQVHAFSALFFAARCACNKQLVALPVTAIRSGAVQGRPFRLACTAAKDLFLFAAGTSRTYAKRFVAHLTYYLNIPPPPVSGFFASSVLCVPCAHAVTATKRSANYCAGGAQYLAPAVRTRHFGLAIAGMAFPCFVCRQPLSVAAMIAKLPCAAWMALKRRAALGADYSNHNKTSLTKGSDIRGWGKLVSVASGLERFMTPFLALRNYTTFGITAPQTALMHTRELQSIAAKRLDAARGGDRRATATPFNRNTQGGFS